MALNNLVIPHWNDNRTNLENLVSFEVSESCEVNSINLESNSSVRLALLDFYNDIKSHKETVKEIKKVQSDVTSLQYLQNENFKRDVRKIDSVMAKKYSLFQPDSLAVENSVEIKQEKWSKSGGNVFSNQLKSSASEDTMTSWSVSNHTSSPILTLKTKKSSQSMLKQEQAKTILMAVPNIVEFRNCEPHKIYKKSVLLRNVSTRELARFEIERRPARSAFVVFVESGTGGDKRDVAPGMSVKLVVCFRCATWSHESEEKLVIRVRNGKPVVVEFTARRDPPKLKVLLQTLSSPFHSNNSGNREISDSPESSSDFDLISSSTITEKSNSLSDAITETGSESSCSASPYFNFDCKKCFIGEYAYAATIVKNVGGRGKFFVMNEIDWCSMNIENVTLENTLIIPPFAIRPAYFALQPNEQLTLTTYFFPSSYGLQVDELYFISDNCAVRSFEIIGDGIMFEPQLLQLDRKKVKYQWFKEETDKFCTVRYLDLGSDVSGQVLSTTFTVANECELDLNYRWDIGNEILCPVKSKYIVSRKAICPEDVSVEPDCGVFESRSTAEFTVSVRLCNLAPSRYRVTLRLIIEDLPLAAVPEKYNFPYEESKVTRRLCDNPVDITFESVEVRLTCLSISDKEKEALITSSSENDKIANILLQPSFTDGTPFLSSGKSQVGPLESSSSSASDDEVCRFIKGYGTCDCCYDPLISSAVLRPEGCLFVGVEHTFAVSLRNASAKRLKYWWGNPMGSDHEKIKVQVDPRFNNIPPDSTQMVKLKCLPLETGTISSMFVPCHYSGINSSVYLSIECAVRALCVTFYYPVTREKSIRVDWSADYEYLTKYDKKTEKLSLLKRKLKDETFLHDNVYFDTSENVVEVKTFDSSKEDSSNDGEEEEALSVDEVASTFENDVELGKNGKADSIDYSMRSRWTDEDEYDENEDERPMLPYFDFDADVFKKHFRYLPLVVEFHVVSGKYMRKRLFLQNESPISSYFRIKTKYLSVKEGRNQPTEESGWGLTLSIEPEEGEIKPYEIVYFDVTARGNSWGIYNDEITISIDHLPPRFFWIKIINDSSPISYPVCRNTTSKIPKIRFEIPKPGCVPGARKLLVENTSDIPVYVNWHCFLIDRTTEEKPFNLIVDVLTPFMSIDEFLAMNSSFYKAIRRFFSCAFNPYQSDKSIVDLSKGTSKTTRSTYTCDNNGPDGTSESSFDRVNTDTLVDKASSSRSLSSDHSKPKKLRDSEFLLNVVPYYGKLSYDLFIIEPHELYLPPKEKRYVSISMNTEKLNPSADSITCKACGFIRIPPLFKYKDNVYLRKDGYYLPPTEVHLECAIKQSMLFVQTNADQHTFEFDMIHFVKQSKNTIVQTKKILLTNKSNEIMNVAFEIDKIFWIKIISTQREVLCKNRGLIHPGESVEIKICCKITNDWMEQLYLENRGKNYSSNYIIKNGNLLIKYKEGFSQTICIFLKLKLPYLSLSTRYLDFGKVQIGDTKVLSFTIHNLSDSPQELEIQSTNITQVFTFHPSKALLAIKGTNDLDSLQVNVKFSPKNQGVFKNKLRIVSEVDGFITSCDVEGSI